MSRILETDRARWLLAVAFAFVVYLAFVSVAHAQTKPFNSQYAAPPTTPPSSSVAQGSGSASGGSSSSGASSASSAGNTGVLSSSGSEVSLLPDTGGLPVAPVLLGGALLSAAGIIAVRRNSRR